VRAGVLLACSIVAGAAMPAPQERTYTNSIGMEFVLIQPGTLLVGKFQPECPSSVPGWTEADYTRCKELVKRDATAGFTVTIERAYYVGKYEVTQREWTAVMGANPSIFQGSKVKDAADRHPVDNVTWADAQAFIVKLNAMEKTTAYRLPTEFEWEYAARAGSPADPSWDEIRELAWEQDIVDMTTHAVGSKKPNAWGLHDVLGNVWEWVQDYYNEKIFADPVPPRTGTTRVLKGGGFLSDVKNTVYSTHAAGPGDGFDVGFRIVRDVP
jgi:sulfatase modifying factor 1